MRQAFTTFTELVGAALVAIGAFHAGPIVGYTVTGLLTIAFGALAARK